MPDINLTETHEPNHIVNDSGNMDIDCAIECDESENEVTFFNSGHEIFKFNFLFICIDLNDLKFQNYFNFKSKVLSLMCLEKSFNIT